MTVETGTGRESSGRGSASAYRPWQAKILVATWLAYAGYYFCRRPFYVTKISLSTSLDLTTLDLANLGTAYLVAYMVGQFSSAFFGRKLGSKMLLLTGIMISITSTAMFGMSNGFWTIMLFMSLNGLAQGTGWPGCIGSLAFWFRRKERGRVLGFWSTCYQLGQVFASLFATFLLDHAGWRWSFFGGAMVLLGIWLIVLIMHPQTPEHAGLPPIADEDDDTVTGNAPGDTKLGWDRSVVITIIMMGLIYFCIKLIRYALWSWLPMHLHNSYSLTEGQADYLSIVFDICGFLGVIVGGFVSDTIFKGRRAIVSLVMLALMALSFLVMYTVGSSSLGIFIVAIGFAGFMLFGPDSLLSGVGAIDVGSKRGALSAAGIINGMGSIGPIFQEQIVGRMDEYYITLLLVMATVSACIMFALWIMSRRGIANL